MIIAVEIKIAGVEGIEPPVAVLETAGLPLTDTPIPNEKFGMKIIQKRRIERCFLYVFLV